MEQIKDLLRPLISNEDNYFEIKTSIDKLHDLYYSITGIKAFGEEITHETFLEYGKAVSPVVAANCMLDLMRTKRFIEGVYKAINTLCKKFVGERLTIVYAGSGPYATLIVPMCFLFSTQVFSCSIIDIHQESIDSVSKIIHKLEIEAYFENILCQDAFSYIAPQHNKPHLIISEVLQMGLQNEPQVALMHHLATQLRHGGGYIPKDIILELYHTKKLPDNSMPQLNENGITMLPERETTLLGNIFSLNTETVARQLEKNCYPDLRFEPLLVPIPAERNDDDTLEIQTRIEVYDDIWLTKNQSSLTIPLTQTSLRGYTNDTKFSFEYKIGDKPKTEVKVFKSGLQF